MVLGKKNSKFTKKMNVIWWLFVFSILFYPIFVLLVIYTDKNPNSRFTKWWKKHIAENKEDYD